MDSGDDHGYRHSCRDEHIEDDHDETDAEAWSLYKPWTRGGCKR